MYFDKSKVYTSVNADELEPGDKVIVADTLVELKDKLSRKFKGEVLTGVLNEEWYGRFEIGNDNYALAYLVERKENCTNCALKNSMQSCRIALSVLHRCKDYKPKTNINLCDSCKHCFADCPATPDDIIFGDGVGNDNVCECDKYEPKSTVRCINCEHYSTYEGYCNKHVKPTRYDNTNCKYYNKVNDYEQKAEKHTDYNHCEEAKKAYVCAMTNACPEKHYRPFRDTDELIKVWDAKIGTPNWGTDGDLTMPHIWVRYKNLPESKGMLINGFENNIVYVMYTDRSMQELFDKFEFLDGSPCGVEE